MINAQRMHAGSETVPYTPANADDLMSTSLGTSYTTSIYPRHFRIEFPPTRQHVACRCVSLLVVLDVLTTIDVNIIAG